MNNLKFSESKSGRVRTVKVQQNGPRYGMRGAEWNSPDTLKARILRQRLVLVGTRQK